MFALVLVLLVTGFAQQPMARPNNRMWADREIRPEPPRESDLRAARLQSIRHDTEELSALNLTLQAQLQQLQKGVLSKDLADNLKKTEKLAKKLRQDLGQ
jgi:hypothetical protein